MSIQEILVLLAFAGASYYLIVKVKKAVRSKSSPCEGSSCGCSPTKKSEHVAKK